MDSDRTKRFRVGEWHISPDTNRVERDGESIKIEPRAMDVLSFLAARTGKVVPAEELIANVWKQNVSDASVYRIINRLRQIFGDSSKNGGYIETIPKRGYRLIADVNFNIDTGSLAGERAPIGYIKGLSLQSRAVLAFAATVAIVFIGVVVYRNSLPGLLQSDIAVPSEALTTNARAYEYYLTGNDYMIQSPGNDYALRAANAYELAIEEDPEFALAWAALSRAQSNFCDGSTDESDRRQSLAQMALAKVFQLSPDLPEAHFAKGMFYFKCSFDYANALTEFEIAEAGMPDTAALLTAKAQVHRALGQYNLALEGFKKANELGPGNPRSLRNEAVTELYLRNYDAADRIFARILEIDPNNYDAYIGRLRIPELRDGDMSPLKSGLANPPFDLGDAALERLWWVALYERDSDRLMELNETIEIFPGDIQASAGKTWRYGIVYQFAGQLEIAKPYFEEVRNHLEERLQQEPDSSDLNFWLAYTLAYLGEREEAMRVARRGMELPPVSNNVFLRSEARLNLARVMSLAGDQHAALEELETYLAEPGPYSIEILRIDPFLDAAREDPRFAALVQKYAIQ